MNGFYWCKKLVLKLPAAPVTRTLTGSVATIFDLEWDSRKKAMETSQLQS